MTHTPLGSETVRLRWLSVETAIAGKLASWHGMLDREERARADRFRFRIDRDTFIAAHVLARVMLSEATGRPTTTWQYVDGNFGKPTLAAHCLAGGLHFNISHSRGFVACAIAYEEVGVDVERSDRPTNFDIADRFFAPEEARIVRSTRPERQACVFFRFWTLKEAFIKATGEGLSRPLNSFSFALDPVRVHFHPERDVTPRRHDPAGWQFAEYRPEPNQFLALAIHRTSTRPLWLDARAAQFEAT